MACEAAFRIGPSLARSARWGAFVSVEERLAQGKGQRGVPLRRFHSLEEIELHFFPERWKRKREEEQRARSILPRRISGRVW